MIKIITPTVKQMSAILKTGKLGQNSKCKKSLTYPKASLSTKLPTPPANMKPKAIWKSGLVIFSANVNQNNAMINKKVSMTKKMSIP